MENTELDKVANGVLIRTILENPRLKEIIASELMKHTGQLTPDRMLQVREHILYRVGLSELT